MSKLSIDLQDEIRQQLNEALLIAMQNDPGNVLKQREIVEAALRKWLERNENQETGAERWTKGRAIHEKLQVDIDESLHNRAKTEALRRKTRKLSPPLTLRALVECALIQWLVEKGYWHNKPDDTQTPK